MWLFVVYIAVALSQPADPWDDFPLGSKPTPCDPRLERTGRWAWNAERASVALREIACRTGLRIEFRGDAWPLRSTVALDADMIRAADALDLILMQIWAESDSGSKRIVYRVERNTLIFARLDVRD